ncbi:NADH-dependent flavin oxidoreductase [Cytospora paraplurivora]|uniref:NADH-dependent flavin oxidoreductase n=1 Tax=Cytospora paraplurivora TaxID=2898453 RepID=A0AAN9UBA2_9PEZI
MGSINKATASKPAEGVPFYTPAQEPPAGTALEYDPAHPEKIPTLYHPITIRGLTLANRFVVSPMCQYSADDGHLTDWHLVHVGQYAVRGAGLTIIEATSVLPNGRISPEDSGLWKESQVAPLRRLTNFVHSQSHKIGIQLSHAGRKGSTLSPWHGQRGKPHVATEKEGGWPDNVWGPSAIPFSDTYPKVIEMSKAQIKETVEAFGWAAAKSIEAGFDLIEIHGAHGYLVHQFLSPLSNHRTDEYGGSFENRTRFLVEVVKAIRGAIPDSTPLFLRISMTDWMEWSGKESWELQQSTRLAHLLPELGVDLLDCSSGGNDHEQKIQLTPDYQTAPAGAIRRSLRDAGSKLLIGAVGLIQSAEVARDIVQDRCVLTVGEDPEKGTMNSVAETEEAKDQSTADVVFIARQFLREPEFVLRAAQHLGVKVKWANQYGRAEWPEDQKV